MTGIILSTKNTNKQYKRGIISAIVLSVLGIIIMGIYCFFRSKSSADELILIFLAGLFLLGDGIITATFKYLFSKSYMDMYTDRIEGKGIQGFSVLDFSVNLNQVLNISTEGIFIKIDTNCGTYKIISDKVTAKKVFDYYCQNMKQF